MREGEQRKVRPLDGAAEPRRVSPGGVAAAAVIVGLVALAIYVTGGPEEGGASSTAAAEAPATRLAVQAATELWAIDLTTRRVERANPAAFDGVPWRTTIDGRRVGEVYYLGEGGEVDLEELPGSVFAILLTGSDIVGTTPLPVALVPIWPGLEPQGYDLVIARDARDGAEWTDIEPLPGCGLPYPIAAPDARDVLSVWCTAIDDVRLLVEFPTGPVDPSEVGGDDLSYETLVFDSTGTIWQAVLGVDSRAARTGTIGLETGEWLPGIAALSRDAGVLYAGVAMAGGRLPDVAHAERIVAYDRSSSTVIWSVVTPLPVESLAVGTDGIVYAYTSGGIGAGPHPDSALLAIDPFTGSVEIVIQPLDLGAGRLLALPS